MKQIQRTAEEASVYPRPAGQRRQIVATQMHMRKKACRYMKIFSAALLTTQWPLTAMYIIQAAMNHETVLQVTAPMSAHVATSGYTSS